MNTNTEGFDRYCWIRAYNALKGKRRTNNKRATTWQNWQNECAPSEDWDHFVHPPSLIRVFAVRMKNALVLSYPLSALRRLIRLGGCPGWFESSLGAHSFVGFVMSRLKLNVILSRCARDKSFIARKPEVHLIF